MKQNKQKQIDIILESAQSCHWSKWGTLENGEKRILMDELLDLLSQTRQEAVEEVFRIMSEELSVAYPDPHKGWDDRIEMNVEDLCDAIEKSLSQEKK